MHNTQNMICISCILWQCEFSCYVWEVPILVEFFFFFFFFLKKGRHTFLSKCRLHAEDDLQKCRVRCSEYNMKIL